MNFKADFIRKLPRVKLVLGNGFDLHCGLHTTYSDFYCANYKKYLHLRDIYEKFVETGEIDSLITEEKRITINIWDVFFALNGERDPKACKKRWCDIEKLMLSSFYKNDGKHQDAEYISTLFLSDIRWNEIKPYVYSPVLPPEAPARFLCAFVNSKMKKGGFRKDSFYSFLLKELKDFEAEFGKFIYQQTHVVYLETVNYGQKHFFNEAYIQMAEDTLLELCDMNNLVGIDSFNYSDIESKKDLLQHINGSIDQPIFGIDTVFKPKDREFIFTKTSRRIDADLFDGFIDVKPKFENIIVYGHSLDEADYNYFFPMFDQLKLTDSLASNVVVFAYTIFDSNREDDIKSDLREAVSKLLYAYAKSRGVVDPERFLDGLSTQKRIITYEIPSLDRNRYRRSPIDQWWEDRYSEIDNAIQSDKDIL